MGNESWSEYCKLVMSELERLDECTKDLRKMFDWLLRSVIGIALAITGFMLKQVFF